MGITVHRTGAIPMKVWDEKASQQLGLLAVNLIKARTVEGRGDQDQAHKPYSTRPITIAFESDSGRRLKPKGGTPVYGFGDGAKGVAFEPGQTVTTDAEGRKRYKFGRSFIFRDTSDDGDTGSTRGPMTGRHYENGYAEYKKLSRRGLTSKDGKTRGEVDLTLSGQMLREFRVIRYTRLYAVIGLTGQAREYGQYVDQKRPWIGISPQNAKDMDADMPRLIEGAQKRAGVANGPR